MATVFVGAGFPRPIGVKVSKFTKEYLGYNKT